MHHVFCDRTRSAHEICVMSAGSLVRVSRRISPLLALLCGISEVEKYYTLLEHQDAGAHPRLSAARPHDLNLCSMSIRGVEGGAGVVLMLVGGGHIE